jgi:hypothetical protein
MKPDREDYIVSEALGSYPMAPLPEGFVANTMGKIGPRAVWKNWIGVLNRIAFLPTALWFFFGGFFAFLVGMLWWGYVNINPFILNHLFRRINYWRIMLGSGIQVELPSPFSLLAIVFGLLLAMGATWILTDPRRQYPAYPSQ